MSVKKKIFRWFTFRSVASKTLFPNLEPINSKALNHLNTNFILNYIIIIINYKWVYNR